MMKKVSIGNWAVAGLALLFSGAAYADSVHVPFTHDSKPLDHASVVGSHRDIHTVVKPTAQGFHVQGRFSQGERIAGAHMCAATDFRDKDGQLIAQVRQGVGINATYGGGTLVRYKDSDVNMSKEQQDKVTFVEIAQAECPANTFNGLPVLSSLADVIKILAP